MPRFDVTGLGTAACDYRVRVGRPAGADEKVRADELVVCGGGTVGTALVTLARLGHRTAWVGCLGDDEFGRFTLRDLEQEGVDTSLVRVVAGARSPFAFCIASGAQRSVYSVRPTTPPWIPTAGDLETALDAWFVHLDGKEPDAARELAREARKRGVGVSLDLQRLENDPEALLGEADLAVVSEAFAHARWPGTPPEQAVLELWRPGMRVAAVTLGSCGSVATEDGKTAFAQPAESVEAVDTTGAGDVFHGALLAGLLRGLTVHRSLRFASHVAALSCTALGRGAVPRPDAIGDWA